MEMALSTVAEWSGSAIISTLVDTAYSYLGERMLPAETQSELRRLNAALPKIAAVMGVAEVLKIKHPNSGVNAWLEQFRLAFQTSEDVLDELKYWELEDVVKNQDQVSRFISSTVGSLKRKFTSSTINEDTLKRLKEAVEMLDLVASDVGHFFQFATALDMQGLAKPNNQHVYTSSRETTSILTENNVLGRETEKAIIIEWLKKPASHDHISAFCIVGPGGLGKTTLAQLIFEEIGRENHFDKLIWVCVSTSFSVEDITRKILRELGENVYDNESLNFLQINLKQKVLSKKVLFILDDVWNDEKMCDWEKLIAPFKFVQPGSKILLTTRMKSVADMLACVLNVERENLVLEGLEEQELLDLLNKYAFYGYNPDNHRDLQNITKDIKKKLRGSPLAAKVIGSLLNSYMGAEKYDHARSRSVSHYWRRILNCDSLINLEQAKNVIDVLKLSYYHLPADLQECFRFCCIFPQDYEFKKDELIKMWMASGFIRQELHGEERLEDIGEEYFNHLFRKSFFERHSRVSYVYVMHDLMHDLAQNVSKGECCRIEPNDKLVVPKHAQHVCVRESEIEKILHLRSIRTLVITPYSNKIPVDPDQFILPNGSLKETLRLLVIHGQCSRNLPDDIGRLIHLRYLSIKFDDNDESCRFLIPRLIHKLHHLQVLEFIEDKPGALDHLEIQTTGITNLVSLRYMDLPYNMMENIHGVHKLTSLQKLDFFVGEEMGCLDELRTLKNLRTLSIQKIENVWDPKEAKNANLSGKENLISLTLYWSPWRNSDNQEQIIDNLQPHKNLESLSIRGYKVHRPPVWMRDLPSMNLSMLLLSNCSEWKDLSLVCQMPYLKILGLTEMNEVKEVGYFFDSTRNACAFPSLENLNITKMPNWESWVGLHTSYGFPNLKELVIVDCPNLAELPAMPLSLFKFEVGKVGLNSLPDIYNSSTITASATSSLKSSLTEVEIRNCPNLKSLDGFLQQQNINLLALKKLIIENCWNIERLPISGFGKLVSLNHLCITRNPKLIAVDNWSILLPLKLQSLSMGNCGQLDVMLLESASRLATLRSLHIDNSSNINCLPYSENAFASLRFLHIFGCKKLVRLSSRELARGFQSRSSMASLKISYLDIDHFSLLLIEPLRSLRFVSHLEAITSSGMESLLEEWLLQNSSTLKSIKIHNANSLRSLPDTMVRLTTLEKLHIRYAALLEELPELPSSLTDTEIYGTGGCRLL